MALLFLLSGEQGIKSTVAGGGGGANIPQREFRSGLGDSGNSNVFSGVDTRLMLSMLENKGKRTKATQEMLAVSVCRGEVSMLCVNPHAVCETGRTQFTEDTEKHKKGEYQAGSQSGLLDSSE